jgi:Rrf2 family protein
MLRVVELSDDGPVTAREVADNEGISVPYAQKLLGKLAECDLVEARRGAHGGYRPAKPVGSISVGDVLRPLGGSWEMDDFCDNHAGNRETCTNAGSCKIRPIWEHISTYVMGTLDEIPLQALTGEMAGMVEMLGELPHGEMS